MIAVVVFFCFCFDVQEKTTEKYIYKCIRAKIICLQMQDQQYCEHINKNLTYRDRATITLYSTKCCVERYKHTSSVLLRLPEDPLRELGNSWIDPTWHKHRDISKQQI